MSTAEIHARMEELARLVRQAVRDKSQLQAVLSHGLTGVVYFAHPRGDASLIKIGYTLDLRERMKRLRCVPLVTFAGGPDLERFFHAFFVEDRLDGEWFDFSPDLAEWITICQQQGEWRPL